MSRSSWKRTYFTQQTLKGLKKIHLNQKFRNRLIFESSSQIPKLFTRINFLVYNGSVLNRIKVSQALVNKKFGELSITRKPFFFPKKKTKGKKR
jgi:ribosomal protein S19